MSKIESKWSNPTGLFALVGLLFAGLLPANVAVAADEEVAIEEVVVTGSRIKRTGLETASPISVFTSADIEASGLTTIEDFIQNIPSVNGAYVGASINNGNPGLATAGLRGLGSGRTLTLINGRRFNSGDLNSIPTSFVERVEVVRDGASTIRLPRRSGISRLLSSSIFTNPGSSPLDDTSMAPDDDAVASSSSGDLPMNPIASSVRLLVFFCSVAGFGWPTTSRSCSMVSIFMRFYLWFIRPIARVALI